jgi:hypothetical protein
LTHVHARKPKKGREAVMRRVALFNLGIGELTPLPKGDRLRRAAKFARVGDRPEWYTKVDTHLYYEWNHWGDRDA